MSQSKNTFLDTLSVAETELVLNIAAFPIPVLVSSLIIAMRRGNYGLSQITGLIQVIQILHADAIAEIAENLNTQQNNAQHEGN